MGAVLGGAPEEDCKRIYRYAVELGLAFQLQDDLLDCYGDQKTLGKRIGGDIVEGKKTFLTVMAMSVADERRRRLLREAYDDKTQTEEQKIERVKGIYDMLDIRHIAEQQISSRFDRALSMLSMLSAPQADTSVLDAFARSLVGRKK